MMLGFSMHLTLTATDLLASIYFFYMSFFIDSCDFLALIKFLFDIIFSGSLSMGSEL